MRYEGTLPAFINCHRRVVLLNQFLQLRSWSGSGLSGQLSLVDDIILDDYRDASGIAPEETKKGNKRRIRGSTSIPEVSSKKPRVTGNHLITAGPIGLCWDAKTASCAYDSFFTILHHIWNEGIDDTYIMLSQLNTFWKDLHGEFVQCQQRAEDLMRCRNMMQLRLNAVNRRAFPLNGTHTCLSDILEIFLSLNTPIGTIDCLCIRCGDVKMQWQLHYLFMSPSGVIQDDTIIAALRRKGEASSQMWYNCLTGQNPTCVHCATCKDLLLDCYISPLISALCVIDLPNSPVNVLTTSLLVGENQTQQKRLRLTGIIYYDEASKHFVARVWTSWELCGTMMVLRQEPHVKVKLYLLHLIHMH